MTVNKPRATAATLIFFALIISVTLMQNSLFALLIPPTILFYIATVPMVMAIEKHGEDATDRMLFRTQLAIGITLAMGGPSLFLQKFLGLSKVTIMAIFLSAAGLLIVTFNVHLLLCLRRAQEPTKGD